MRRGRVVGNSGPGKSTLAAALAVRLGARHLELDAIYHQADRVPLDDETFRQRVGAASAMHGW